MIFLLDEKNTEIERKYGYKGKISKDEAEQRLKVCVSSDILYYLFRKSTSNDNKFYLSFILHNKFIEIPFEIQGDKINRTYYTQLGHREKSTFENFLEVLEFYKSNIKSTILIYLNEDFYIYWNHRRKPATIVNSHSNMSEYLNSIQIKPLANVLSSLKRIAKDKVDEIYDYDDIDDLQRMHHYSKNPKLFKR